MFTENFLKHNLDAVDKAGRGGKTKKNEAEDLKEIASLKSFSEITESMDKIFDCFNKKLKNILKNRSLTPKAKFKRYNELSGLKREISLVFSDHINRLNTISDYEKSLLNFKQHIFLILHNYFDMESELEAKLNPDANSIKSKKGNKINIEKAEAQQYLAGLIVKDPKNAKEAIGAYREAAEDTYGLPLKKINGEKSQSFDSIESGIYGLAAAYCYYGKDDQRIVFANPEIDASEETDFFLINTLESGEEEKKEIMDLSNNDFYNIDKAQEKIKQRVARVQVKCQRDCHLPVEEIRYDYAENKIYMGEEDKEGKAFVINYNARNCPEYMTFFDLRCKQKGLSGRFITFSFDKANEIIENTN